MASPCEVLLDSASESTAHAVAKAVAAEVWRIEDKFSRYRDDSVVQRINTSAGEPVEVDDETARLLDFANTLFDLSGGAFDITSGALREVWVFDGSDRIPEPDAVAVVLDRVGWSRVEWESPVLTLQEGMEIDFGGIGKEYAVDRSVAVITWTTDVPGLVNLGGDLAVTGPPTSRSAWKVGIEGPRVDAPDRLLDLRRGGLATSGDARRFLLREGTRYSHILDPSTGWPVANAPNSITVAADTCTQAGMLSTLAMLKGPEAEAFLEAQGVRFWCRR